MLKINPLIIQHTKIALISLLRKGYIQISIKAHPKRRYVISCPSSKILFLAIHTTPAKRTFAQKIQPKIKYLLFLKVLSANNSNANTRIILQKQINPPAIKKPLFEFKNKVRIVKHIKIVLILTKVDLFKFNCCIFQIPSFRSQFLNTCFLMAFFALIYNCICPNLFRRIYILDNSV